MKLSRALGMLAVSAAAILLNVSAYAEDWKPQRPVKLIVSNAAGGGADFFARLFADKISAIWGQPVIVENHGGAAGRIGAQMAVTAAPDGYTILIAQSAMTLWPAVYDNLPFNVQTELQPVTTISEHAQVVTVNPTMGVKTIQELIDYAKAHPAEVNFASNGVGTTNHLAFELFQRNAGIQLTHIPYPGTAQRLAAILANETQLDYGALTLNQQPIDEGKLIGLMVSSKERLPSLPNVPTAAEAGHPEIVTKSWDGVFVPKGTPPEIIRGIVKAYHTALADPAIKDALLKQGRSAWASTPEEMQNMIADEIAFYEKTAREAGVLKSDASK